MFRGKLSILSPKYKSNMSEILQPDLTNGDQQFTTKLQQVLPFILGGLGVVLILAGVGINYIKGIQNTISIPSQSLHEASIAGETVIKTIKVDVSGAVGRPGVYELPYDSRTENVLIAAGGLVAKADRKYISKSINLAQRLTDGAKVYFPFVDEASSGSIGNGISGLNNLSNLININLAAEASLDTLPGIGPVTAQKIISGRPYQNISELVSKKVISNSVYTKIKDRIAVY